MRREKYDKVIIDLVSALNRQFDRIDTKLNEIDKRIDKIERISVAVQYTLSHNDIKITKEKYEN